MACSNFADSANWACSSATRRGFGRIELFILFSFLDFRFQKHDILAHDIEGEGLPLADGFDVVVGEREDIAAPAVAEWGVRAVAGIVGGLDRSNGFTGGCGRRCGIGPVATEFFQPWLDTSVPAGGKAVQDCGQFLQFGGDPADGFQHGSMSGVEIHPVDDAFVMEDAVAKFTQKSEATVEGADVALGFGCGSENPCGQLNDVAVLGGALVEKSGPESEGQLGDNPPGGEGFVLPCEALFGFVDLALLSGGEQLPTSRHVIPVRRAEMVFQGALEGVAQGNFDHLQG